MLCDARNSETFSSSSNILLMTFLWFVLFFSCCTVFPFGVRHLGWTWLKIDSFKWNEYNNCIQIFTINTIFTDKLDTVWIGREEYIFSTSLEMEWSPLSDTPKYWTILKGLSESSPFGDFKYKRRKKQHKNKTLTCSWKHPSRLGSYTPVDYIKESTSERLLYIQLEGIYTTK